jgi:Tfp pilus assembly protein PilX
MIFRLSPDPRRMRAAEEDGAANRRARVPNGGSEQGSTLILALVFILVVGAVVYSQLGLAFTGTRIQRSYRIERELRYNGNNALWAAVEWARRNPTYGTEPTAGSFYHCGPGMNYPLQEDTAGGLASTVIVPGSTVNVDCSPVSSSLTGGVRSGAIDSALPIEDSSITNSGGQGPRDIVITVRCTGPPVTAKNQRLSCGGLGGRIIAQARVRYEINYDPAIAPASRAIVPKIVWWHLNA